MQKVQRIFTLSIVLMLVAGALGPAGAVRGADGPAQTWIVQGASATAVAAAIRAEGGEVTAMLPLIDGVVARLSASQARELASGAGITGITPDAPVRLVSGGDDGPFSFDPDAFPLGVDDDFVTSFVSQVEDAFGMHGEEVPEILGGWGFPETDVPEVTGADLVWDEGYDGTGVTVAVVDTGIGLHPGVLLGMDGAVRLVGWKDFVQHKCWPKDPNGHGTHVAGIIADSMIGANGEYNGVAPNVNLVGVRVLDRTGYGTYSRVIQGIQWVVDHKDTYNIKVMNLSLVALVQSPYWADPLNQAVMGAWADGITVVVAAGNNGPVPMSIGVPGNTPYVITVGAFTDNYTPSDWDDDYITPFSAAGPTLDGFVKPDVIAPGAHIVSTMLPNTYLARKGMAEEVAPGYYWMAGTSQAAAVVSGMAALVLEAHPDLTPDEVKFRIQATAFPWIDPATTEAGYSVWQQGYGRVNAYDAVMMDGLDGYAANQGMDIAADLAGDTHYEGFSYYDEDSGTFKLQGYGAWSGGYGAWSGGYGAWSGGYGAWSGGYGAWSGGYGTWSGGYGAWSGGYGAWSGGYGAWSGGYGAWSGGYGAWSGGYGAWSGGYGAWSGSEPWAGSVFAEASFVEDFLNGVGPDASATTTSIGIYP